MNTSRKDIIIGFVIIALLVILFLFFKKTKEPKVDSTPKPVEIAFKEELEDSFKYNIPDDSNAIELKDVSGGNSRGIATEKEILLDIDDPQVGSFYQGWLQKGDSFVPLGRLQIAKGGWLLEYDKTQFQDYKNIIVSLESRDDSKIEKKILEGSFN